MIRARYILITIMINIVIIIKQAGYSGKIYELAGQGGGEGWEGVAQFVWKLRENFTER